MALEQSSGSNVPKWKTWWSEFRNFLSKYKIILMIHVSIMVVVLLIELFAVILNPNVPQKLDFSTYYSAAKQFFEHDPLKIYDDIYMNVNWHCAPYRYLPSFVFAIYPFTFLELAPAYILFAVSSFICTLVGAFYILKIIRVFVPVTEKNEIIIRKLVSIYLLLPFHYEVYGNGQISAWLGLLIILGLYYLFQGRELAGSLCIGLCMFLKPAVIITAFFLIITEIIKVFIRDNGESFSERFNKSLLVLVKRLLGIALPLLLNVVIFLIYPGLLSLAMDSLFVPRTTGAWLCSFPAIFYVLGVPYSWFLYPTLIIIVGIALFITLRVKDPKMFLLASFIASMFAYFMTQLEVQSSQLVYLYSLLVILVVFCANDLKGLRIFYYLYAFSGPYILPEWIWPTQPVIAAVQIVIGGFGMVLFIFVLSRIWKLSPVSTIPDLGSSLNENIVNFQNNKK